MIDRIHVIGSGRVGSAVAARLSERGIAVRVGRTVEGDPQLVLLCVPDAAIADVARGLTPGPLVAHVERRDAARARSTRTCGGSASIRCRPSRARAGPSSSTAPGPPSRPRRTRRAPPGCGSPRRSGCGRSSSPTRRARSTTPARVFASNYLVTLHRAASLLFESAGAPPEALEPLMRRTIENDFELTGPIARGDWATVEAHRAAIRAAHPELERALRDPRRRRRWRSRREDGSHDRGAARASCAARSGSCRRWARCTPATSRSFAAARAENDLVVASLFVNAAQFGEQADLAAYPRDEAGDAQLAAGRGRRRALRAGGRRDLSAGLRHLGRRRRHRRGRRGARRSLPRRRDRLREALQDRAARARVLRPEGRAAGGRRSAASCAT